MDLRGLPLHAVRVAACAAALASVTSMPARLIASVALFFALFTVTHDVMHGAYRLSKKNNDRLLSLLGVCLLGSGHAMRRMHMLHHARPLADDDVEGAGARGSLLSAIAMGPLAFLRLRLSAFRRAPRAERRTQLAEWTLVVLITGATLLQTAAPALTVYVAVTLSMWLLAPVWAAHVPHNTPAWLERLAVRLSFTQSPVVLSLAFHDRHHDHPKVPCHRLAELGAS